MFIEKICIKIFAIYCNNISNNKNHYYNNKYYIHYYIIIYYILHNYNIHPIYLYTQY